MYQYLRTWLELKTDKRAVTALEYGMIAALIAAAVIGAVTALGTNINATFTNISSRIATANGK